MDVWRTIHDFRNLNREACVEIVQNRFASDPLGPRPENENADFDYDDPGVIHKWVELDGVQTIEFDVKRLMRQLDCTDVDTLLHECYARMHVGTMTGGAVNLVFDLGELSWSNLTALRRKCTHDDQLAGAALYVALKEKTKSVKLQLPSDPIARFFVSALVVVCVPSKIRDRMTHCL
tara:strand:+ start:1340 stop:1870 length:531 start_codon:yes stop_codon:yes gene_type:complete